MILPHQKTNLRQIVVMETSGSQKVFPVRPYYSTKSQKEWRDIYIAVYSNEKNNKLGYFRNEKWWKRWIINF